MSTLLRWGLPIVAIVAAIDTLRALARFIVTEPFEAWPSIAQYWGWLALIGCVMLVVVARVVHRNPRHGRRQYVAVVCALIAANTVITFLVGRADDLLRGDALRLGTLEELVFVYAPDIVRYSVFSLLIAGAWLYLRAEAQQAEVLKQVAVDSARMDQQTAEARLQVLEAQIEPHFLFNTLAHVKRLYEIDPASGARMLQNLKAYLAVALPEMRETESTLSRELGHVTAYLNVQQIRMGRRLAFAIDLPPDLRGAAMPSLMILTLVENAIKHGLGPSQTGGRIDVRASSAGGRLRVDVADTGHGFARTAGGGTGLANIRARLRSLFGDDASLSLAMNAPRGVVATLVLPQKSMRSPGAAA